MTNASRLANALRSRAITSACTRACSPDSACTATFCRSCRAVAAVAGAVALLEAPPGLREAAPVEGLLRLLLLLAPSLSESEELNDQAIARFGALMRFQAAECGDWGAATLPTPAAAPAPAPAPAPASAPVPVPVVVSGACAIMLCQCTCEATSAVLSQSKPATFRSLCWSVSVPSWPTRSSAGTVKPVLKGCGVADCRCHGGRSP